MDSDTVQGPSLATLIQQVVKNWDCYDIERKNIQKFLFTKLQSYSDEDRKNALADITEWAFNLLRQRESKQRYVSLLTFSFLIEVADGENILIQLATDLEKLLPTHSVEVLEGIAYLFARLSELTPPTFLGRIFSRCSSFLTNRSTDNAIRTAVILMNKLGPLASDLFQKAAKDLPTFIWTALKVEDLKIQEIAVEVYTTFVASSANSDELLRGMVSMCLVLLQSYRKRSDCVAPFLILSRLLKNHSEYVNEKFDDVFNAMFNYCNEYLDCKALTVFATLCESDKEGANRHIDQLVKIVDGDWPLKEACGDLARIAQLSTARIGPICSKKALALLKKTSPELEQTLQSIITSAEMNRNTGRAVFHEAVDTIVALSSNASLKGLAFNQVGRLLSMRDPNVLYSALSSFARVLYSQRSVINRGSVDAMALQRYKSQIVKCLDHQDPSIRRRALDVISALIDEKNVETLVPEILSYVKLADAEFRTDLVSKIYAATQRFAPNVIWNFDTVHQILINSGDYVPAEIIAAFCDMIGKTATLHQYAVEKLRESLLLNTDNQSLIQVASFVMGELAQENNGEIEALKKLAVLPQTKPETLLYIISAVAKIAVRLELIPEALALCTYMVEHNNLEVQQRAGELMKLLAHPEACQEILAPISNATEADDQSSIQIQQGTSKDRSGEHGAGDDVLLMMLDTKKKGEPAPKTQPVDDLLNLDIAPTNQPSKVSNTDLLSALAEPAPKPQPQAAPMQMTELLRLPDFAIYGQSKANAADPRQIALRLLIFGTGSGSLNDFKLSFNISPGWQMNIQPADGSVLLPNKQKPVSQILYLMNATNAPFQLQVKATYKFGSQPLSEVGAITTLPPPQ